MSVLSFPRLYFTGHMSWDPCTANNNDYLPVYASADAGLDWDYLATQGINSTNFRADFKPWVVQPNTDSCPPTTPGSPTVDNCGTSPTCHMASRWDYFGGGGCHFVDYDSFKTLTVGGATAVDQPISTDPLIGQPVTISGNTFGGRPSEARLVDVNPAAPWGSLIYFANVGAGDESTFIGGPQHLRMASRAFLAPRNISADLIIAGAIGVVFQTAIPAADVICQNGANSPLLTALCEAIQAQGAQGLMLRFSASSTLYYQNGTFNDFPRALNCDELTALYQDGQVFSNPAYSRVSGVFGVWGDGELVSAPQGRFLVPNATLTPVDPLAGSAAKVLDFTEMSFAGHSGPQTGPGEAKSLTASDAGPALAFGVAWVEVDETARLVSLDLSNAIPEYTTEGEKFDYGILKVGVQLASGTFKPLGSFPFTDYNKAAYEAKAGLVDVPFGQGLTAQEQAELTTENVAAWLTDGQLALQSATTQTLALLERPLTAETDDRGLFVDQCQSQQITVQVRYKGAPAPNGTLIDVEQYYPWPLKVGPGQLQRTGTEPGGIGTDPVCDETPAGPYVHLPVTTVAVTDGQAIINVEPLAQGFPVLAWYPYLAEGPVPTPQDQLVFGYQPGVEYTIGNAYFSTLRVMPFDNSLVNEFVDRWNGTGIYDGQTPFDRQLTWEFIYGRILYVYDMLYPVMDQIVPLGDLSRVEGAIDQVIVMVSKDWENTSTLYMPVTRELSAGKRIILETWGNLVVRKYPQEAIPVPPVPCTI